MFYLKKLATERSLSADDMFMLMNLWLGKRSNIIKLEREMDIKVRLFGCIIGFIICFGLYCNNNIRIKILVNMETL